MLIRDKELNGYAKTCEPRNFSHFEVDQYNTYHQGALAARFMGRRWLSYQVAMGQLLNAKNSDGSFKYKTIVVCINRQTGKTTTVLDNAIGRVLFEKDYHLAYAAQTGLHTSKKFRKLSKSIEASNSLKPRLDVMLSAGSQSIS